MPTITTVKRLADDTTEPITITRGESDHSWGVVDPAYTGRRCTLCDMPHVAGGLCDWHYRQQHNAPPRLADAGDIHRPKRYKRRATLNAKGVTC